MLICFVDGDYAVVVTQYGKLTCTACPRRKVCRHILGLGEGTQELLRRGLTSEEFDARVREYLDARTGVRRLTCVSKVHLAIVEMQSLLGSFPSHAHVMQINGVRGLLPWARWKVAALPVQVQVSERGCPGTGCNERGMLLMVERGKGARCFPQSCCPPAEHEDKCPQCAKPWSLATCQKATRAGVQSRIYHLTAVVRVDVWKRVCNCGAPLHYDGSEDGILNLDNVDLFTHELLHW